MLIDHVFINLTLVLYKQANLETVNTIDPHFPHL